MLAAKYSRAQAGDTIIEVLIAIMIVGSVLVGSFTIANASLKQIRQAQERSEAQKVAVSSIEKLDKFVVDNPAILTGSVKNFCIESSTYAEKTPGTAVPGCIDSRYSTSITRTSVPNSKIFIATVSWDGLNGRVEQVSLSYRVKDV